MPTTETVIVPDVRIVNVIVDPVKYDNCTSQRNVGNVHQTHSQEEQIRGKDDNRQLEKNPTRSTSLLPSYHDITAVRIHR